MTTSVAPGIRAGEVRRSELAACCLGPLAVFADGREIPLRPGRARSLLQYLLIHRHVPVPRDVLMEEFWPGADPARARNSLNVAACELGRALRPAIGEVRVMERQGDLCRLNPDLPLWTDLDAFDRLIARGDALMRAGEVAGAVARFEEAVDLYEGDLFSDDPYASWIERHRWVLQDTVLRALHAVCAYHLDCDNPPAAAEAARQVLRIVPDSEEAHRALMVCHARLDRRSLALRQYGALVERLRRTGLAPGPETADLHDRIRRAESV